MAGLPTSAVGEHLELQALTRGNDEEEEEMNNESEGEGESRRSGIPESRGQLAGYGMLGCWPSEQEDHGTTRLRNGTAGDEELTEKRAMEREEEDRGMNCAEICRWSRTDDSYPMDCRDGEGRVVTFWEAKSHF